MKGQKVGHDDVRWELAWFTPLVAWLSVQGFLLVEVAVDLNCALVKIYVVTSTRRTYGLVKQSTKMAAAAQGSMGTASINTKQHRRWRCRSRLVDIPTVLEGLSRGLIPLLGTKAGCM